MRVLLRRDTVAVTRFFSRKIEITDRRKSTGMFQRSFSSSAALEHAASGAGTDDKGKSVDKTRVTRALFSSPTKENTQAGISERHKRLKVSFLHQTQTCKNSAQIDNCKRHPVKKPGLYKKWAFEARIETPAN